MRWARSVRPWLDTLPFGGWTVSSGFVSIQPHTRPLKPRCEAYFLSSTGDWSHLNAEQAVKHQQLHVVAQSQFDMQRRPCGVELLLRWTHPSGENITPDRFIPIAEETGLIVGLGAFVFERGCALVRELDALGCTDTISISVSPRQFRQPDFVDYVKATIARLDVAPDRLVFEVTESLLIEDVAQTANRMHELRALGIRFSIDDFGTGYSSLAYLRALPLYELKIDRAFIDAALSNANDAAIVKLILGIAAQLDIKVVAEGVETDLQFDFLAMNGCDVMQGFLLARPVKLDDWIRARTAASKAGLPFESLPS